MTPVVASSFSSLSDQQRPVSRHHGIIIDLNGSSNAGPTHILASGTTRTIEYYPRLILISGAANSSLPPHLSLGLLTCLSLALLKKFLLSPFISIKQSTHFLVISMMFIPRGSNGTNKLHLNSRLPSQVENRACGEFHYGPPHRVVNVHRIMYDKCCGTRLI
ncbi:hypothetical protein HAX54_042446 [Datura stramonium]|uniref:Uncharacterized protein n=1 Tax=Datura stramonium TaxID=4076 RepID=A0ABS8W374_DATST|nr:hypothetical protein [Datura stramonium]